jgi:hypothetical protein
MWEFIGGIGVGVVVVGLLGRHVIRELKGDLTYFKKESKASGERVEVLEAAAVERQ